jgi:hypothetical protein
MKRLALLILSLGFTCSRVLGQAGYDLKVSTEVYVPLATGTVVSGGTGWVEPNYSIPLGFEFPIGDTVVNTFNLASNVVGTGTVNSVLTTGFMLTGAQLCDRGLSKLKSESPLRYEVSGAEGHRVFKFEYANAGFAEEYFQYHTNADHLNLQIWLFEASGVVEYHFGASSVAHHADYFPANSGVSIGFVRNYGVNTRDAESQYLLSGPAMQPSVGCAGQMESANGLIGLPPAGTVYRFVPMPKQPAALHTISQEKRMTVFPVNCRDFIQVVNPLHEQTRFELLSAGGGCVQRGDLQHGGNRISTGGLTEGMYIPVVNAPSGTELHRIIKS